MVFIKFCYLSVKYITLNLAFQHFKFCMATIRKIALIHFTHGVQAPLGWPCCVLEQDIPLQK